MSFGKGGYLRACSDSPHLHTTPQPRPLSARASRMNSPRHQPSTQPHRFPPFQSSVSRTQARAHYPSTSRKRNKYNVTCLDLAFETSPYCRFKNVANSSAPNTSPPIVPVGTATMSPSKAATTITSNVDAMEHIATNGVSDESSVAMTLVEG